MTKKKPAKKYINLKQIKQSVVAIIVATTALSCQPRAEKLYKEAYEKINANQYAEAIKLLESAAELQKNSDKKARALFEAARLLRFETQDYDRALKHYKKIILESEDVRLRLQAQEAITEIYFDHLQDYVEALKELITLEPLIKEPKKKEKIKLKIAQAQKLIGNLEVTLQYINLCLEQVKYEKNNFLKLKAELLQAQKKPDEALKIYFDLEKNQRPFFLKETMYFSVVTTMEEKQDFKAAIEYLEKNKNSVEDQNYFNLRLQKLRARLENKPFTKGIRK